MCAINGMTFRAPSCIFTGLHSKSRKSSPAQLGETSSSDLVVFFSLSKQMQRCVFEQIAVNSCTKFTTLTFHFHSIISLSVNVWLFDR